MTAAETPVIVERFPSMGTTVEVAAAPAVMDRALMVVRMTFAQWDAELSRFRPDSELSQLNRRRSARVSPLVWEVVRRALGWAASTGGLFDPCLGGQLACLGYDSRVLEWEPDRDVRPGAAPPVSTPGGAWRGVRLDTTTRRVTLPDEAQLDLGGIAKGMAVDAALHQLEIEGLTPVLVNAGGDLGVREFPRHPGFWSVGVGDPSAAPPLYLKRGAVATSGISRRRWMVGGRRLHHILDPRTGYPAETGLRQVTVVGRTAEEAEVLATASFLEGLLMGRRLIERAGAAGRFVASDGSVGWAGAWPRPEAEGVAPWRH